jgi:hypothetical protein
VADVCNSALDRERCWCVGDPPGKYQPHQHHGRAEAFSLLARSASPGLSRAPLRRSALTKIGIDRHAILTTEFVARVFTCSSYGHELFLRTV